MRFEMKTWFMWCEALSFVASFWWTFRVILRQFFFVDISVRKNSWFFKSEDLMFRRLFLSFLDRFWLKIQSKRIGTRSTSDLSNHHFLTLPNLLPKSLVRSTLLRCLILNALRADFGAFPKYVIISLKNLRFSQSEILLKTVMKRCVLKVF